MQNRQIIVHGQKGKTMARLIDADATKEVLTKLLMETALNNSGDASLMCESIAEDRLETWLSLVPSVSANIAMQYYYEQRDREYAERMEEAWQTWKNT